MTADESFRPKVKASARYDPSPPIKRGYTTVLANQRSQEQNRGRQRQPVREFNSMRSGLSRAKKRVPRNAHDMLTSEVHGMRRGAKNVSFHTLTVGRTQQFLPQMKISKC
jgi:hypothetical protein